MRCEGWNMSIRRDETVLSGYGNEIREKLRAARMCCCERGWTMDARKAV